VDVAKSQFPVTWGLRFPSMLQRVRSISHRPVLKTKCSGGTTEKCSLLRWQMNHFALKLVIASLLEHNLNKQISHFHSSNSTRRADIDESFGSSTFEPDIALPSVR